MKATSWLYLIAALAATHSLVFGDPTTLAISMLLVFAGLFVDKVQG